MCTIGIEKVNALKTLYLTRIHIGQETSNWDGNFLFLTSYSFTLGRKLHIGKETSHWEENFYSCRFMVEIVQVTLYYRVRDGGDCAGDAVLSC